MAGIQERSGVEASHMQTDNLRESIPSVYAEFSMPYGPVGYVQMFHILELLQNTAFHMVIRPDTSLDIKYFQGVSTNSPSTTLQSVTV